MTTPVITLDTIKRLEQLYLPKWPQMFVWGEPVTVAQAQDIILRTDKFLTSLSKYPTGNNRPWIKWAQETLRHSKYLSEDVDRAFRDIMEDELRKAVGFVETEYVSNNWASCSYVFGPYGWCHPDGTIWFSDNIGKDPNAREILEEWLYLASAFPFLDLTVTLMSAEAEEPDGVPVVSFRVKDGFVAVLETRALPIGEKYPRKRDIPAQVANLSGANQEQGLPDAWIHQYGERLGRLMTALDPVVHTEFIRQGTRRAR